MGHLFGICLILVSAASFRAMAVFAKFAYLSWITTNSLLFFRFSIAMAIMLSIALIQKRKFPKGKDLCTLIAMGAIGYAGQSYCYFKALTLIPPSLVAILLYLYPVIVAILSVFFLNESLSKNKLFALCLAVSGTVLVIGVNTSNNITGIILGIGAALIYSVYTIAGAKVMKRNDIFASTLVVIGSAACFYFFCNLKTGFFFPITITSWMNIMAIAIISTVIAIYTYFHGMKLSGVALIISSAVIVAVNPKFIFFFAA